MHRQSMCFKRIVLSDCKLAHGVRTILRHDTPHMSDMLQIVVCTRRSEAGAAHIITRYTSAVLTACDVCTSGCARGRSPSSPAPQLLRLRVKLKTLDEGDGSVWDTIAGRKVRPGTAA